MAERITHFKHRIGRKPLYPWDEWTDGSAWRITRGQDFDVPATSMRAMVVQRANALGTTVRTSITEDGESVEFQFVSLERAA